MNDYSSVLGIIFSSFVLEDPTTLAVGSMISLNKLSFELGFIALTIGIFLGDLGLYLVGRVFRNKSYELKPTTMQIALARFLPGLRTVTFAASGYSQYDVTKFIVVTFLSSIVWTYLLLRFTDTMLVIFNYFPLWFNIFGGIMIMLFSLNPKVFLTYHFALILYYLSRFLPVEWRKKAVLKILGISSVDGIEDLPSQFSSSNSKLERFILSSFQQDSSQVNHDNKRGELTYFSSGEKIKISGYLLIDLLRLCSKSKISIKYKSMEVINE